MKLFNKSNKKNNETHRLPMGNKSKRALAMYAVLVLTFGCFTTTAFAASDPLTVINNPGFDLPKTGGYGTWMFTIGGVGLLGVAAFIVVKFRKRNEQ